MSTGGRWFCAAALGLELDLAPAGLSRIFVDIPPGRKAGTGNQCEVRVGGRVVGCAGRTRADRARRRLRGRARAIICAIVGGR